MSVSNIQNNESDNVGYGNVRAAQKIASAKGWKPHKWSSLEKALALLRLSEYYRNQAPVSETRTLE